jgi:hypothetical protein
LSCGSHLFEYKICCFCGPLKHGGINNVELISKILELLTSFTRFLLSLLTQGNICPPLELTTFVPDGLPMPHKDHFGCSLL